MRERLFSFVRPTTRRATLAIDVVAVAVRHGDLAVLLLRATDARARERWMLPWDAPRDVETLMQAAARIVRAAVGAGPALMEQVGAFGDGSRHPGEAALSLAYSALVRPGDDAPDESDLARWFSL